MRGRGKKKYMGRRKNGGKEKGEGGCNGTMEQGEGKSTEAMEKEETGSSRGLVEGGG
jgi:hypothetical protein